MTEARLGSTMTFLNAALKALARGSWAATCLDPSEEIGPITIGRAGGATTRLTTLPFLSSQTTHGPQSRWRVVQFSTLSTTVFTQRLNKLLKLLTVRT